MYSSPSKIIYLSDGLALQKAKDAGAEIIKVLQ